MLIILFFFLSLLFRTYNLNLIPFSGDSGRDLIIVSKIFQDHQLPLLGPPTSIGWLHLGPFIYYFWLPIIAIFQGDPRGITIVSALLDSAVTALIFYYFQKTIGKKISALAALFYATSPLIIIWSRTPLHPSLSPALSTLLLVAINAWKKKPTALKLFIMGLISGLLLQTLFASIILVTIVLLYTFYLSGQQRWKTLIFFSLPIFITHIPLILYDSANNFFMTKRFLLWIPYRILDIFGLIDKRHTISINQSFDMLLRLKEIVQKLFSPGFPFIFTIVLFFILISVFIRKSTPGWFIKFCFASLFLSLLSFFLQGSIQEHYFTFLFPIIAIFTGLVLYKLSKVLKTPLVYIVFLLISTGNIFNLINSDFYLDIPLSHQKSNYGLSLKIQEQMVDWIIYKSSSQPITIEPRPDITNLPNYLDNYRYLLLWRGNKTPLENNKIIFTIYDIWPYSNVIISPQSEIKLFPASAVVLTQKQILR